MATQLSTRRRALASLGDGSPVLQVPVRYLVAIAAGCVAFTYLSLFAAIYNAGRDETAAERTYANTRTLIEAPAPDLSGAAIELEAAKAALAEAEALMAPGTIDPESDETTALLVRSAQDAGLSVAGITRIAPAQTKTDSATYDVQANRVSVEGAQPEIGAYLFDLYTSNPALVATIVGMTVNEANVARAEIVFSAYTKVEPTAAATPGATR
jgi:hypothetical protein